MTSLLRALVVVLAVSGAGIGLPALARPGAEPRPSPAAVATPEPTRVTPSPTSDPTPTPAAAPARKAPSRPLRSVTVALDPGHQLGNRNFPEQTNALVPAGGFDKPCNTTGTATNSGVPEATVTMRLSQAVRQRLRSLGARVVMTRTVNRSDSWGPCVDARGRFGREAGASLMVSLHADGADASGRGFHVIAPAGGSRWTDDIAVPSLRLAKVLRGSLTASGVPVSNYTAGGTGLNVRDDLGTLNLSDVPVAMIEIGNMRNSGDAQRMTSSNGQAQYASAVVRGIRAYLGK